MSDKGETGFIVQCYTVILAAYLIPLFACIVLFEPFSCNLNSTLYTFLFLVPYLMNQKAEC